MVRDAVGQIIQPLLSSHRTVMPPLCFPDRPKMPDFAPWTEEEDRLLDELRIEARMRELKGRRLGRGYEIIK
jgi:hypothetical protein